MNISTVKSDRLVEKKINLLFLSQVAVCYCYESRKWKGVCSENY